MTLWIKKFSLKQLNAWSQNTLISHLKIRFTEIGPDFLAATLPFHQITSQPMGILHGGASCVLMETVSTAAAFLAAPENKTCVGLELNINHLKKVTGGIVEAIATPLHVGRSTQVWEARLYNQKTLIAAGRLTVAVLEMANVDEQKIP